MISHHDDTDQHGALEVSLFFAFLLFIALAPLAVLLLSENSN